MAEKQPPPDSGGPAAARPTPTPNIDSTSDNLGEVLRANVISDALDPTSPDGGDRARRQSLGLPTTPDEPVWMMIEINLLFPSGVPEARRTVEMLVKRAVPEAAATLEEIGDHYMRCRMTVVQAHHLGNADADEALKTAERAHAQREARRAEERRAAGTQPSAPRTTGATLQPRRYQSIYRIWPDFIVHRQVDASAATVKADAARRSFDASGEGIAWAVIDSGVDARHPHFRTHDTLGGMVEDLHYDFTVPEIPKGLSGPDLEKAIKERREGALRDEKGHGTHVAGIIAGALLSPFAHAADDGGVRLEDVVVARGVQGSGGAGGLEERSVGDPSRLSGIAPRTKIVSLKALIGQADTSSNVIRALHYIRTTINGNGKIMRVHGVNLSLGYEFDPKWFACGQSPICVEVDRLVRSGVVVVVAAGNTGYGRLSSIAGQTGAGMTLTINDPGNAALAITVGATHRESPHTFGVSYFSSKGPTGDGRLKPDLVAPGERITSCASGENESKIRLMPGMSERKSIVAYIEDSGTSMAAPHVSGAVAAFLSIRREFIGKPEEIKRIFLDTATSLGRERYFEGRGLVDLMRAIQSV